MDRLVLKKDIPKYLCGELREHCIGDIVATSSVFCNGEFVMGDGY